MDGLVWRDQLDNEPAGWWFQYDGERYGPYDTRREAEDDLRGLRRFEKHFEKHKGKKGFVSVDDSRRET